MKNIVIKFTDEELPKVFSLMARTNQTSIQKMIKFLIQKVSQSNNSQIAALEEITSIITQKINNLKKSPNAEDSPADN